MKPIKLIISAFGPYKEKVNIDFSKLGENGIFLITGDTGAGKTTIFDAISFALFGEVSGSNRPIQSLRSDFANIEQETYVELEFMHKNINYVIRRNPEYERPKKRGEGTTKKSADASLQYENEVISGIKNVDTKIEEILGINAKQFKQIAMLAQGEFLKILFAESKDRTEIFRKIFDTDIYNLIAKKLKEKLKESNDELNSLKQAFITNVDNIIWSEEKEELDKLYVENILMELKNEIKKNENEKLQIDNEVKSKEKDIKEKEDVVNQQTKINDNIIEFNNLVKLREEYQNQAEEIKNIKDRINKNQLIKEKISPKEEKIEIEKNTIKDIEKEIENITKSISLKEEAEKESSKKLENVEKIGNIFKEYSKDTEYKNELDNNLQIIEKAEKLQDDKLEAVKEYEKAEKEYIDLNNEYLSKEDEFFKEQAGILAEKLELNKPCPVCGSLEHPNIAKKSDSVLSKEELEKLKRDLEDKQKLKQSKQEKCISINSSLKTLIKENERIFEDITETNMDFSILKNKISGEKGKKEITITANEEILKSLYYEVKKEDLEIESFEYEKFKEEIINKINEERNKLIQEQTVFETKNKQLEQERKTLNKYEEDYMLEIKKLGFNTEKEYKDILMTDEQIKEENGKIEKYNTNVITNNTKIEGLEKEVKNKKLVDLTDLNNELILDRTKLKDKQDKQIDITSKFNNNEKIYSKLKETGTNLNKKEKECAMLEDLSKTANGTLPNKKRIEFEQYVQATYFDMIIAEANKRLLKMTEGRFVLVRKENPERQSDRIGLDLEVIDNYTGKKRDVKSLSGGESFKAALSLALGLSDVIQSYSGGVVIDTLFIDEGFGSLDTESREQAINTLSLLIDGNKLVGIISHVTELKERIDKKIIVTKTNEGSRVEIY